VEVVLAFSLVALLLAVAGYFAWRQVQTLRGLRQQEDLPRDDRIYLLRQAWRRLIGCALMGVLAALLAGWYLFDFESQAAALHTRGATVAEATQLGAAQQRLINFFSIYWAGTTLVLLAIICVGAVDYFAIRRFGLRHYRQLQSDHRAMIERDVALLRRQRNGHN
jgi:hypothetical protein